MKRIAIITGASSGFGREYVLQYSAMGECDELWLFARRKEKLEETKQAIFLQNGGNIPNVRCVAVDIAGEKGVQGFSRLLQEESKVAPFTIELLINNAGFGTYGEFTETEIKRQLASIEVNVYALTGFTAAVIPYMSTGGAIINLASMASFMPVPNFAVYAATKAYVLSFSISLSAELREKGISVLAVCPGPAKTEFGAVAIQKKDARMKHAKPADKVVAHSLRCLKNGRRLCIYSLSWKISAFLSRFIGRYFFANFVFHKIVRIS
ncbi:SDR family NAD(P)-dependent oxidoreductase [Treponema phagedenis]|uniref:SDR family NAD(P)-dependent oxidoreductase n=1 Tax=Treponema phagedenis TaxID=162 RepID=UPI00158264A3|nr:SDR family NAD(P)-dependent oxidoreductase [Treponema phagedenis]NVP22674.1 SDR family NAD(P)-dependent oxidoreductase [Treponema phagedenis]QKS92094.1 SDR family NAD(P)-dependent oxidoreductase [Treponema phagedenis]QLC57587.1 SDR family NAD(P)-dependent oxidoreductase [Treponema phagedenis]